ncbi:ferredoxin [Roseobacter sp. HKCCA0434]|uniref:ferredoxin n=1 Tax=Roseobacter sp. HKCCA0434 TaxID=3079297 RepID=UPI002905F104|nr:ferredoxin [Roseobacter sp. HKCCA0434]
MTRAELEAALGEHALLLAGLAEGGRVALLAPDTRRFWAHLDTQPEAHDGLPDRVDRWSARVIGALADRFGAEPMLPFGGPPWHPFIAWAAESGQAWPSPVTLLVHARMGLWVSFRGALRLPEPLPALPEPARPCAPCPAPCRTACPVDALTSDGYDAASCKAHVMSDQGLACRTGCLVRKACPVGRDFALPPAQARHHMRAFTGEEP